MKINQIKTTLQITTVVGMAMSSTQCHQAVAQRPHFVSAAPITGAATVLAAPVPTPTTEPPPEPPPGPDLQPDPRDRTKMISAWQWNWATSVADPTYGVEGANRRVQIAGYRGVMGDFAEPIFDVEALGQTKYVNKAGETVGANKPTFYLGVAGGQVIADAGFQWEPDSNAVADINRGWKFFQRATVQGTAKSKVTGRTGSWGLFKNIVPNGQAVTYRFPYGSLQQVNLVQEVNSAGTLRLFAGSSAFDGLTLNFGPIATAKWPNKSNQIILGQLSARRVVGLTQGGGTSVVGTPWVKPGPNVPQTIPGSTARLQYDGSVVSELHFSRGFVLQPHGGYIAWPQASTAGVVRFPEKPSGNSNNLLPDVPTNDDGSYVIDFVPKGETYSPAEEPNLVRRKGKGNYKTDTQEENVRIRIGGSPPATARGK